MSAKAMMRDIQKALEQSTGARVATAPEPVALNVSATPARPTSPIAPSRVGRIHLGAYLNPEFKRSVLMLRAITGEDFQSLLARMLNEQFRTHNLPVVDQD